MLQMSGSSSKCDVNKEESGCRSQRCAPYHGGDFCIDYGHFSRKYLLKDKHGSTEKKQLVITQSQMGSVYQSVNY